MREYDDDELLTYYFVIVKDRNTSRIQAWTDKKALAELYMEFHKCSKFKLKKVTASVSELVKITDENRHDQLELVNLTIRNRDKSKPNKLTTLITIPATQSECVFLEEETNSFLSSRIDYGALSNLLPYLKSKYQQALADILLPDVVNAVVYGKMSPKLQNCEIDQLSVLIRHFPDSFG